MTQPRAATKHCQQGFIRDASRVGEPQPQRLLLALLLPALLLLLLVLLLLLLLPEPRLLLVGLRQQRGRGRSLSVRHCHNTTAMTHSAGPRATAADGWCAAATPAAAAALTATLIAPAGAVVGRR